MADGLPELERRLRAIRADRRAIKAALRPILGEKAPTAQLQDVRLNLRPAFTQAEHPTAFARAPIAEDVLRDIVLERREELLLEVERRLGERERETVNELLRVAIEVSRWTP